MTDAHRDLHVYLRSIAQGERTSLSVLAGMVTPGSRVLDLGTGSGALGKHLRDHAGCSVDGVTINEQEAAIARPHYRRIEIADLEREDWSSAFSGEQYDFIVCADVLEHLRRPETTLKACRTLLAPAGQVLISVPNAAYSGLVAELLNGDFTYRDEGLLDRTHLRFFTRRSLLQFLQAEGWSVGTVEAVERPLTESEFKLAFDRLPPAVARYLLAVPDAGTYQLVVSARPGAGQASDTATGGGAPIDALFSAQLYVGTEEGYREDEKLVLAGVVGRGRQVLRFSLPRNGKTPTALRLDPADRPGFLQLHRITLLAGELVVWQWRCDTDGLEALQGAEHHEMLLRSPWPASAALILLLGEDPRIILPVSPSALQACAAGESSVLEVELGWPMSADYLALAELVQPLEHKLARLQREATQAESHARERAEAEIAAARSEVATARSEAEGALKNAGLARLEVEQARERALEEETRVAATIAGLDQHQQELSGQLQSLLQHNARLESEKDFLARQRLALQVNQDHLAKMYEALAGHLRWIESSTVFRVTRPLVRAKMKMERLLGKRPPETAKATVIRQPVLPRVAAVDVIVPVYKGLDDTRLCVESVLASKCLTPWRLVIVNDASPQPEVTAWLREVAQRDNRILLLENRENLGFVGTVNRGMAVSQQHDVLLLNSDTEVANNWLDRLRNAAYSDARVASVTPFSNNATICSYPRFCEPNKLPPHCDTASLDALFAATNPGQVLDVPTGVGFCMYIRRDCLDALGLFDVKNFGKGYGEENDFCRRAAAAGWRNLHSLDTFVLHTGGVSFGDSKSARERDAMEKLRRLHPSYDGIVHAFVAADPARGARLTVDVARLRARQLPCVLAVLHDRSGGTLRHVGELARHLNQRAIFFSLTPTPGSTVQLELLEPGAAFRLEFSLPGQWEALLGVLRGLGIVHIHYHHLLGHRDEILHLGERLGVRWDFTAHDYYSMCPQISLTDQSDRYCGETGEGQCHHCIPTASAPHGMDIAHWRERNGKLLTRARYLLAPSLDTARRFKRMFPEATVRVAPHTDIQDAALLPVPAAAPLPSDAPLKVVVIGALSRIKGADVLEDVAVLAARSGASVEFHLLGYAYRDLRKQPNASLTVHGSYEERDLRRLLDWLKPDLVWFPALWPETYSYTLSACLEMGFPVVAPDIGAFHERLGGRAWSWVTPWDRKPAEWLDFFVHIRRDHFASGRPPRPPIYLSDHSDAPVSGWSYEDDYFRGLAPQSSSIAPLELVHNFSHEHHTAISSLKKTALLTLLRLRSAKGLRRIAKAVPHQWQGRIKGWLRK